MSESAMHTELAAMRADSGPEAVAAKAAAGPAEPALIDSIVAALKTVYDPEIPVDIWELGLIYRLDVDRAGQVEIDMTVTTPACPVAGELPGQVQRAVETVDGVQTVKVELVWDPPWHPGMMSEDAKLALDMY